MSDFNLEQQILKRKSTSPHSIGSLQNRVPISLFTTSTTFLIFVAFCCFQTQAANATETNVRKEETLSTFNAISREDTHYYPLPDYYDWLDCVSQLPDYSEYEDGWCNGGLYNTFECEYDGGDCHEFNHQYPDCDVELPYRVGENVCWAGSYNTPQCGYDGGDCVEFNEKYPNCQFYEILPHFGIEYPDSVGDGRCDEQLNIPECEWDGGDCCGRNGQTEGCPTKAPTPMPTKKPPSPTPPTSGDCVNVKIQVKTDEYPEETSWKIEDAAGYTVLKTKTFNKASKLYEKSACLPITDTCEGTDYTFTIYDTKGDGLCCGEPKGNGGYYNVLVEGKEVATGGNDFAYEKSISLCQSPPPDCSIGKKKPCKATDGCFWKSNKNNGDGTCRPCSSILKKNQCFKIGCEWTKFSGCK